MNNPIIMQLKMELAKTKKDFQELQIKLTRLLYEMQSRINPYFGDNPAEIKAEEIKQIAVELLQCRNDASTLKTKIENLKKDLDDNE